MPRMSRLRRGPSSDVGVIVLPGADHRMPGLSRGVHMVTRTDRAQTDLARTIGRVLANIPGFSEFECRLLASLIARRLHTEGYRK